MTMRGIGRPVTFPSPIDGISELGDSHKHNEGKNQTTTVFRLNKVKNNASDFINLLCLPV